MNDDAARTPGISRIVVGIDGSAPARAAALWAAAEAHRHRCGLHIVHAVGADAETLFTSKETARGIRAASEYLLAKTRSLTESRFPALTVTTELTHAEPADALNAVGEKDTVVVVGSRGLGGFGSLALGSVSLEVAASCPAPVVVVRGESDAPLKNVVLAAVRGEDDLDRAVLAAQEAALRRASLRLVSVWSVLAQVGGVITMLDSMSALTQEHRSHLEAVADRIRGEFPALPLAIDMTTADSTAGVLVEASHEADLLVAGKRDASTALGSPLGRVTHALLHHAYCPVLVAPRPQ